MAGESLPGDSMKTKTVHGTVPWRTLILFLSVTTAILVSFFLWGDAIDAWVADTVLRTQDDRLIVASLLFAVLASDILLPIPSSLVSTLCGVFLGAWLGTLVSTLAMTVSCLFGYLLGRLCERHVARLIGQGDLEALTRLHDRMGIWLLLGLRPVPVLAEASLVFAGLARTPPFRTALLVTIGNGLVSAVYAVTGAWFSSDRDNSSLAFLVCFAFCAAMFAIRWLLMKTRGQSPGKIRDRPQPNKRTRAA